MRKSEQERQGDQNFPNKPKIAQKQGIGADRSKEEPWAVAFNKKSFSCHLGYLL